MPNNFLFKLLSSFHHVLITEPISNVDILTSPEIMNDPVPLQETITPVPILPQKPLLPVRVAPPPPTAAPPIPPRAVAPQPPVPPLEVKPRELNDDGNLSPPSNLEIALARRQELKTAALQAKRAGDQASALQFVRLVKVRF